MTCEVPRGITIEFPFSGIEVNPIKVDIRSQKRQHTMAEFILPEDAGLAIGGWVDVWSLAFVKIKGKRSHRLVYPRDGLSFDRKLDDRTRARLELRDPRYILDRTSIDQTYDGDELGDMIESLLSMREDPENVIDGFEIVGVDDEEHVGAFSLTDKIMDSITGPRIHPSGSIDFRGTLLDALQKVADWVSADWWIGEDGTLYFGEPLAKSQSFTTSAHSRNIVLSRYSVTQEHNTVSRIQLRGNVGVPGSTSGAVEIIATAHNTEEPGSTLVLEEDREIGSLSALEDIAERRLLQESMEDTSGSMTINGKASENDEIIRKLGVGDLVFVNDGVKEECKQDVVTGLFMITDVHHRRTQHSGWEINVDVAKVIDPDDIETESVLYDAQQDKEYGNLDDWLDSVTN